MGCNFAPQLAHNFPFNKDKLKKMFKEWNEQYPSVVDMLTRKYLTRKDRLQKEEFVRISS